MNPYSGLTNREDEAYRAIAERELARAQDAAKHTLADYYTVLYISEADLYGESLLPAGYGNNV